MQVHDSIKKLVQYGVETGLCEELDRIYVTNRFWKRCIWMNMRSRSRITGMWIWKRH